MFLRHRVSVKGFRIRRYYFIDLFSALCSPGPLWPDGDLTKAPAYQVQYEDSWYNLVDPNASCAGEDSS
jgi:hypothetical protein